MRSANERNEQIDKIDHVREPLKFVSGENFQTRPSVCSMIENLNPVLPLTVPNRKHAASSSGNRSDSPNRSANSYRSEIRDGGLRLQSQLDRLAIDEASALSPMSASDSLDIQLKKLFINTPMANIEEVTRTEDFDESKERPSRERFRRSENDQQEFFSVAENPEIYDHLTDQVTRKTEMLDQIGHLEVESNLEEILERWKPGKPFPSEEVIEKLSKEKDEKARKTLERAEI